MYYSMATTDRTEHNTTIYIDFNTKADVEKYIRENGFYKVENIAKMTGKGLNLNAKDVTTDFYLYYLKVNKILLR